MSAKSLLREFISEVVIAGEFEPGDIRPEGNYRPIDNYRPVGNYRPEDPRTYLGMTQPSSGTDTTPDVEDGEEGDSVGGDSSTGGWDSDLDGDEDGDEQINVTVKGAQIAPAPTNPLL